MRTKLQPLPQPDHRLRTYYMLECDCSGVLGDGFDEQGGRELRAQARAHRRRCSSRLRLNRTVTLVWKERP